MSDTLPHSLDVERAVLATCLDGRHKDAVPTARERLTCLSWYARNHRLIWLAIESLDDAGVPVDSGAVMACMADWPFQDAIALLLAQETQQTGKRTRQGGAEYSDSALQAVGGPNAVTDLLPESRPAGLARNVAAVADYAAKRRLIVRLTELCEEARQTRKNAQTLAAEAVEIGAAVEGVRVDRTLGDGATDLMADHDRMQSSPGGESCATWGIRSLDAIVPLRRRLVILAAPPGSGKTSLALEIQEATSRALGPGTVAYASFEMDAPDLASVRMSRSLGIPRETIDGGRMSPTQREAATIAVRSLVSEQVAVLDGNCERTTRAIIGWIRRLKQRNPAMALVIIDHIGLMRSNNPRHTEYDRISEITGELKAVQKALGIVVVALCQLNREGQKGDRDGKGQPIPRLADLRGSGSIEQDADSVIVLQKPSEDGAGRTIAMVAHVLKNRAGITGTVDLSWHRHRGQRFTEAEPIRNHQDITQRGPVSAEEDHFR